MRVARKLRSRLYRSLFVTFSRQPAFLILETIANNHQILLVLTFPKCGLSFCVVNHTGDIKISIVLNETKIVEILIISGNIESTERQSTF